MRKILLVGINEKIHTTQRIIDELKKRRVAFDFIKWGSLIFSDKQISSDGKKIDFDHCAWAFFDIPSYTVISKKNNATKRINFRLFNELAIFSEYLLEKGVRLVNGGFFIKHPYYNKFTQSQMFPKLSIPSITTVHPIDNNWEKIEETLFREKISFPLVIKKSEGGMGQFVWKAGNAAELKSFLKNKRNESFVYQPFLKNDGDYRVLVVNGKSLGIMKRKARGKEWKNNFALGGSIEKYQDKKMETFAEKTCRKMGLEYAGVDIFKIKGKYLIVEINVFACFEGFEKIYPEINIASKIIDCIIK
jgi:RimK family alpha-L-glutamate ligase